MGNFQAYFLELNQAGYRNLKRTWVIAHKVSYVSYFGRLYWRPPVMKTNVHAAVVEAYCCWLIPKL